MAGTPSVGHCISDDTRECGVMAPGSLANRAAAASFDSEVHRRQQRNASLAEPKLASSQDHEKGRDVRLAIQEASNPTPTISISNTPRVSPSTTSTRQNLSTSTFLSTSGATTTTTSSQNPQTPLPDSSGKVQATSDEPTLDESTLRIKAAGGGGGGGRGGGGGGGGRGGGGGGGRGGGGGGGGKGGGGKGGGGGGGGGRQGQGKGQGNQRNQSQNQQAAALAAFSNPAAFGGNPLLGLGIAAVRQGQRNQEQQQQEQQQEQQQQQKEQQQQQEKQQQMQQQQQLQQQIQQQQQQIQQQQQQIQQQQQQQQNQSQRASSQRQSATQTSEAGASATTSTTSSTSSTVESSRSSSATTTLSPSSSSPSSGATGAAPANPAAGQPQNSKSAEGVRASPAPAQQPPPARLSPAPSVEAPPPPPPAQPTQSQSVAAPEAPQPVVTESSASRPAETPASATPPAGSASAPPEAPLAASSTASSSTTTPTPQVNLGAQEPSAPSSTPASTGTQGVDQSSLSSTQTGTEASASPVSSATSITTTATDNPAPSISLGKAGLDTSSNTRLPPSSPSKDDSNNVPGSTGSLPKSSSPAASAEQASPGLSKGSIAGISTGLVAVVFFLLLAVWLWKKSKAKKRGDTPSPSFNQSSPNMTERSSGGPIPRARLGAEKLATSLGFLRRGSMSQIEGDRQQRVSQGPPPAWGAAAVPRDSFRSPAAGYGMEGDRPDLNMTISNPVSDFRPELGLNTEGFGSLDPFADVNSLPYGAAFAPAAANNPSSNPFADPRPESRAFTSGNRPPSHSRSRSASVYNSFYPPPPVAFRPSYAARESLQSNTAFGERRNKFRSDPFDLESRLAPSEDDLAQMPRLNGPMSTYSSHTRGSSLPYSQYTSGVSVSDWSAIGANLWPQQAGQSQDLSGEGNRRGDRSTVGQAL